MKTDELIILIAEDARTPRPSLRIRMATALAVGGLVAAMLFAKLLGFRPDLAGALLTWRFDSKLAIVLLSFATALWITTRLMRPDSSVGAAALALIFPLLALAVAVGCELSSTTADTWMVRAVGANSRVCLAAVTGLAIPPLAALLVVLRAGAPRSPTSAGAAAGLLAGGLAAALYATHCPDDSPLFVLAWYVPAIALVALGGAAVGNRMLRW